MELCSCDACRKALGTDQEHADGLCSFCAAQCFPVCEYGVRIQKTHPQRLQLHGYAVLAQPVRATVNRVVDQVGQAIGRALVEDCIPLAQRAIREAILHQVSKHLGGGR